MNRHTRQRTWPPFYPLLLFGLGLGCATVEAPSGGPEDKTPPVIVAVYPDSGSRALSETQKLVFVFSEKMEPVSAERFLALYPAVPVQKTKWHGRREVEVILAEPLPPDTVVVVEIRPGLVDVHRVASVQSRRYPLTTAVDFPAGELTGQLVYKDQPLIQGVVELYDVPPDTLEYFRQPILRRTQTDSLGAYRFAWLPVPGGPWLVRAFVDANKDLRPGENEAQRLLPGQFALVDTAPRYQVGFVTLFEPKTPGRLVGSLAGLASWPGRVLGWAMVITEEDTGWTAAPASAVVPGTRPLARDTVATIAEVPPGLNRLVVFVDADGDSMLSALPAAGQGDSVLWYLEPHTMLDSLTVEPGLDSAFPMPRFPATLTPWWKSSPAPLESAASQSEG